MKNIKIKLEEWLQYIENYPENGSIEDKESFRSKNDRDCFLTNGNLLADTIISLWIPFRRVLIELHSYDGLNNILGMELNKNKECLKSIIDNFETLFPEDNHLVQKLEQLTGLGLAIENVMILPNRRLQSRGLKPYYDYVPHFLYDILTKQKISYNIYNETIDVEFMNDKHSTKEDVKNWIEKEHLTVFFKGGIIDENNIIDCAYSGNIKNSITNSETLPKMLDSYITLLRSRKTFM